MPHGIGGRKGARRSRLLKQARSGRTRSRGGGPDVHRGSSAQAEGCRTKDLGGDQEAHGRVGHRLAETAAGGTDSTTEQRLEGELDAGGAQKGGSGNANPGGVSSAASERQEGKGPGDRVRLMSSGILRGVGTARGRDRRPGNRSDEPETRRTPRLAAGCNKPATLRRSKPTRWCKTTRLERDSWSGRPGAEGAVATSCREWTPVEHVDEGAMRSDETCRAAMPDAGSVRTNPRRGGRFPTGAKQRML
jgi:hypothetical protein